MPVKFSTLKEMKNPDKFSIIPLHASDRAAFKQCRRYWVWSSPSRLNLVPKSEVHGIRENFWFGTGIHGALEKFYSPLREDPSIAFETWWNTQVNGGLIDVSDLKEYADRYPEPISVVPQVRDRAGTANFSEEVTIYRVQGLSDILPYYDEERFAELLDLGKGMMRFYKQYAEVNDDFTVVATEHDFSVPVLDKDGNALYMQDPRIMPNGWEPDFTAENEFGSLMREGFDNEVGNYVVEKQVHARGRMDMILQDNDTGRYGIKDYKTAASITDDYFKHLDLDEQTTTYLTLGEVEAIIHDMPYRNLEFIRYEALFKGYPKPPTVLKDGITPSLNRQSESTTAELFAEYIKTHGLTLIFERDQKMKAYYEWLVEMGDKRFVWPVDKWRNKMQRLNARIRLYYEAIDMLSPTMVAYPNPRKEYNCLNCVFRTPCLQAETGDDYTETLQTGYISNYDR